MANELNFSLKTRRRVENVIYNSFTYAYIFSQNDISLVVELVQKLLFEFYYNQKTHKPNRIIKRSTKS